MIWSLKRLLVFHVTCHTSPTSLSKHIVKLKICGNAASYYFELRRSFLSAQSSPGLGGFRFIAYYCDRDRNGGIDAEEPNTDVVRLLSIRLSNYLRTIMSSPTSSLVVHHLDNSRSQRILWLLVSWRRALTFPCIWK